MRVVIDGTRTFSELEDAVYCRTILSGLETLLRVWKVQHMVFEPGHKGLELEELWFDQNMGRGHDITPILDLLMLSDIKIKTIYVYFNDPLHNSHVYETLCGKYKDVRRVCFD